MIIDFQLYIYWGKNYPKISNVRISSFLIVQRHKYYSISWYNWAIISLSLAVGIGTNSELFFFPNSISFFWPLFQPKTIVPIRFSQQWLITILAALFIPSRIWRLRFSVMAVNRFDQKPWAWFSLRVDTCLLYQRFIDLIFFPSTIKLVPTFDTQVNQLFTPWSIPNTFSWFNWGLTTTYFS